MLNRRSFFAASAAGIAAGLLPGVGARFTHSGPVECDAHCPYATVDDLRDLIVEYYTPIFTAGFKEAWDRNAIAGSGRIS